MYFKRYFVCSLFGIPLYVDLSFRRAIPNAGSMVRNISITEQCAEPVIVYNLGTIDVIK